MALGVYLGLHLIAFIFTKTSTKGVQRASFAATVTKRVLVRHGIIALAGYGIWGLVVHKSYLGQRIKSGEVFRTAFPEDVPFLDTGLTTVPERMDVLLGSRFDANFLGVYNRALDYHPGNRRFNDYLSDLSGASGDLVNEATKALVNLVEAKVAGVSPRFLRQQYIKGAWAVMSEEEALEFSRRALLMKQDLLTYKLGSHLRRVLADSRFGLLRNTAMARVYAPLFVNHWENVLFGVSPFTTKAGTKRRSPRFSPLSGLPEPTKISNEIKLRHRHGSYLNMEAPKDGFVTVGDRVYAHDEETGEFDPAIITHIGEGEEWCTIAYATGGAEKVPASSLRVYRPMKEGDRVMVEVDEGSWAPAIIYRATPFGTYDVRYENPDDGGFDYSLVPETLFLADLDPVELYQPSPINEDGVKQIYIGQPVEVYFEGDDTWFKGNVIRVNPDNTYTIDFEDNTVEVRIRYEDIRVAVEVNTGSEEDEDEDMEEVEEGDDKEDDEDNEDEEPEFFVGQRVVSYFEDDDQWFEGRIREVNDDGESYAIDYLDGDEEDEVPANLIRAIY